MIMYLQWPSSWRTSVKIVWFNDFKDGSCPDAHFRLNKHAYVNDDTYDGLLFQFLFFLNVISARILLLEIAIFICGMIMYLQWSSAWGPSVTIVWFNDFKMVLFRMLISTWNYPFEWQWPYHILRDTWPNLYEKIYDNFLVDSWKNAFLEWSPGRGN